MSLRSTPLIANCSRYHAKAYIRIHTTLEGLIRMNVSSRAKLTITVDKEVLDGAKKASRTKRIPLSRAIENFLEFFAKPEVYCFKCGQRFGSVSAELCAKCGWLICPHCESCRCGLGEETAIAVFHMRRLYEDLLAGRVKRS